jgi:iron transport multicopper oxidase
MPFPPDDTVITLADWYHYVSTEAPEVPWVFILSYFVSQVDNSGRVYNSTLINGKGRYFGGPSVDLAVVNVLGSRRSVLHFPLLMKTGLNMRHSK